MDNLRLNVALFDIQTSINNIFTFLGKKLRFEDYQGSLMLRKAVERELITIGEAMSNILKINPRYTY